MKAIGWLAIVLANVLLLVILDIGFGLLIGVADVRVMAKMFVQETAPLAIPTQHLLPNLSHTYIGEERPEGNQYLDSKAPRLLRTDRDGFITGPSSALANRDRFILFLGGSTTETNEVDEEYRFPYLASKIISNSLAEGIHAINAGIRAHTTLDSINIYLNHPSKQLADADVVVLMHNINDRLFLAMRGSEKTRLQTVGRGSFMSVVQSANTLFWSLKQSIVYSSNILFWIDRAFQDSNAPIVSERNIDFQDPDFGQHLGEFETNLRTFVAVVRAKGKTPVLMTQPLGKDSAGQSAFNTSIRTIARKTDTPLVDLDESFSRHPGRKLLFFGDLIHLNNEGSQFAAGIIAKRLLETTYSGSHEAGCSSPFLQGTSQIDRPINSRGLHVPSVAGRYPSLSSNRATLLRQVYEGGKFHIEILTLANGKMRRWPDITSEIEARHPAWMPNGRDIVFGAATKQVESLHILNTNTWTVSPVMSRIRFASSIPAVAKNGDIFFAGYEVDGNGNPTEAPDLYWLSPGNRTPVQLTKTPWEEWRPQVSPDGRTLFFISDRDGSFDIYKMDLQSRRVRKFFGSSADEWDPSISENGKWLVFASRQYGSFDLFLSNLALGGAPRRLTWSANDEWDPRFVPGSEATIIYASESPARALVQTLCINASDQSEKRR